MKIPYQISRRRFLQSSALAAFALPTMTSVQGFSKTPLPQPSLTIPPLELGNDVARTREYNLNLQTGVTQFFQDHDTKTSGINGAYLGPTVKIRNGDKVRFNVTNGLNEISTLHWHGAHLPASQDGGPHQVIQPGKTWSAEFNVKQKAASLWYHPHIEGRTAAQVWQGMAGMLIVEDDETDALNLPSDYGIDDIPLILQDRHFDSNGQLTYDPSMHFVMMGMTGDIPLTNGAITPVFEAKTKLLRLRILNGSNASFYHLGFDNNKPFKQIASDGGLLEAPVEITRLALGPAERVEIIIELKAGEKISLRSFKTKEQGEQGNTQGMMGNGGMGNMMSAMSASPDFKFLDIQAASNLAGSDELPDKLVTIDRLNEQDATVTRTFDLQMNMGPRVMMGLVSSHLINDKVMKMSRIDEQVKLGATEIWEIRNNSFMAHPFHIHDVQFQILDRNGKPPAPVERGRKDVVVVNTGETVRLIMKFEDYSDPKSPYMYHCHILEHEDAGMMGQFTVV